MHGTVTRSVKASLLSALVFPGAGHLYLKKYAVGLILAVISMAALAYLAKELLDTAQQISAGILSGTIQPDMESITTQVTAVENNTGGGSRSLASAALLLCWLFGLFDSYRAGKKQDRADN